MEKFLPILRVIQTRLSEILLNNQLFMKTWDTPSIKTVGEDLVKLAQDTHSELIQVEHRILYLSLRDAGLGIRDRAVIIQKSSLKEEDKEYFRSIQDILRNICEKIGTGEYYNALLDVEAKRKEEIYSSLR